MTKRFISRLTIFLLTAFTAAGALAQEPLRSVTRKKSTPLVCVDPVLRRLSEYVLLGSRQANPNDRNSLEDIRPLAVEKPFVSVADSLLSDSAAVAHAGIIEIEPIPLYYTLPVVFDTYRVMPPDTMPGKTDVPKGGEWLQRKVNMDNMMTRTRQAYFISNPGDVLYNTASMPQAPEKFEVVIDPTTQKIETHQVKVDPKAGQGITVEAVDRRNWIHAFNANLQFSQAYVSPNWYQGGNNNHNVLGQIYWNVKLNQVYHPKLLFENTVQYKLGLNSTPDDTLRNYSISDDIFQVNTMFGVKAVKRWYYSLTMMFKTQLLNSYKSNSNDLRSAFLSPADFNLGLGMTYNYAGPKNKFVLDVSIAPLSYNLKICTNRRMNPVDFGIEEGHKSVSQYGSNMEVKLKWAIAYNITLQSRLFGFTNYENAYWDLENTLRFEINRFLTTQIYLHMRYDTTKPRSDSDDWKKFQLKEIFSFGFAYRFATI